MDQEFYLVGHQPHTRKHLALGPYAPGTIAEPARGTETIRQRLTEDGRYPHLEVNMYRVTGADNPAAAWRKVQAQLRSTRKADA